MCATLIQPCIALMLAAVLSTAATGPSVLEAQEAVTGVPLEAVTRVEDSPPSPTVTISSPTPSSVPPSTTVSPPTPGGAEEWRALVASHFPADQVNKALAVLWCESRGNPRAYNKSSASGLMQVKTFWADHYGVSHEALFDPEINLWIAADIYLTQGGWKHWTCA